MNKTMKFYVRNTLCVILMLLVSATAITGVTIIGADLLQDSIYTISIYDDGTLTEIRTTNLSVETALLAANISIGEYDQLNVDLNGTLDPANPYISINRAKQVSLTIGNEQKTIYTVKDSVAQVLAENNIQVGTFDYINTIIENPITNQSEIIYRRAIPISLNINGTTSVVYSTKGTIGEVLAENGIVVNDDDFVNQNATDTIDLSNAQINLMTAHAITLKYDGISKTVTTQTKTVGDLLSEHKISLSSLDRLANGVTVNSRIKEGMTVAVIRVSHTQTTETITLPYNTNKQNVATLSKGTTKTVTKGVNGSRTDTYTIVTENGKQVSKTLTNSVIKKAPVDAVIQVGTKIYSTTDPSFHLNLPYTNSFEVSAVAYNLEGMTNRLPTDPNYGKTANGMQVRVGIIAVDRKVIPLGTKVYVEVLNGNDYGYAIAADVGVKGYTVDLYMNSRQECITFGRRKARVYILKDQSVNVFALR